MSGHSKWATTKHKKAANDAKRSKLWAKLIKNIEIAAKLAGSADLSGNPGLYEAVSKAKKNSVPKDNIDRAVKRGAGLLGETVNYEELRYGGMYSGVGFIIECLTDNKNRAASEVRTTLVKNGGQLSDSASVEYNFERKGVIIVPREADVEIPGEKKTKHMSFDFDTVFEAAVEGGAENAEEIQGETADGDLEDQFEITTAPNDLDAVLGAIKAANIEYNSAEVIWYPKVRAAVEENIAEKVLNLIDLLDELDDVQNVYTNME